VAAVLVRVAHCLHHPHFSVLENGFDACHARVEGLVEPDIQQAALRDEDIAPDVGQLSYWSSGVIMDRPSLPPLSWIKTKTRSVSSSTAEKTADFDMARSFNPLSMSGKVRPVV
jgi:hypothetical protein